MKYAMSDIHGCYDEFIEMLNLIKFSNEDELYIIGDVIDRGPDPIKLIQYIMTHDNIHLIMGNHEKMMLDELIHTDEEFNVDNNWYSFGCWKPNGGYVTYDKFKQLKKKDQEDILEFLKVLPLAAEVVTDDCNYILVHGGPSEDFKNNWDQGVVSEAVLWTYFETCSPSEIIYPGKIIVVGHMPTFNYGCDEKLFL